MYLNAIDSLARAARSQITRLRIGCLVLLRTRQILALVDQHIQRSRRQIVRQFHVDRASDVQTVACFGIAEPAVQTQLRALNDRHFYRCVRASKAISG